jgi:hypothetical protein
VGLGVHEKTISYCVKDASGRIHPRKLTLEPDRPKNRWPPPETNPRMDRSSTDAQAACCFRLFRGRKFVVWRAGEALRLHQAEAQSRKLPFSAGWP